MLSNQIFAAYIKNRTLENTNLLVLNSLLRDFEDVVIKNLKFTEISPDIFQTQIGINTGLDAILKLNNPEISNNLFSQFMVAFNNAFSNELIITAIEAHTENGLVEIQFKAT